MKSKRIGYIIIVCSLIMLAINILKECQLWYQYSIVEWNDWALAISTLALGIINIRGSRK